MTIEESNVNFAFRKNKGWWYDLHHIATAHVSMSKTLPY